MNAGKVYKFNPLAIIMKIYINKELDKIREYVADVLQENLTKPFLEIEDLIDIKSADECIIIQKDFNKNFIDKNSGLLIFDKDIAKYHDLISDNNIIMAGIRHFKAKDHDLLKKIKYYSMKEISFEGIEETCNAIMSACRAFKSMNVIINSDVLDPAFNMNDNIPGGLSTRELIYLLQRIKLIKNLNVVQIITEDEMLGAKLAIELS